jgi:hypothetical protein
VAISTILAVSMEIAPTLTVRPPVEPPVVVVDVTVFFVDVVGVFLQTPIYETSTEALYC